MATSAAEIIGRDAERAAIEALLAGPRPVALVVEGEAGIGKTTLWSFAVDVADKRGERILAWQASSAERELAFGALMGLLNTELEPALGALPSPRRRALEVALGRREAHAPAAESLVGLAVLDLVRDLATRGGLVVGLDDAQWCDPASAAALTFAARRLRHEPVAFVLSVRTGIARQGASAIEAAFAGRRTGVTLGPMSIGGLGRLIHERQGVAHPRPVLVRIHEASRGNPFVALEMSHSLLARGVEPTPGEPFPVSPEAEPLVRDHLAALGEPAREALLIVAMSSQPTVALLERVMGPAALPAIDEACRAGVLAADGERLRAAHPLFASTAYGAAPPGLRRGLRRTLAESVEDPLERAVHRAATIEGSDPPAGRELEAAARLALGRGAPAMAADLLERAGAIGPAADRLRLLLASADARMRAGDAAKAADLLRTIVSEAPHGRVRVEALLALGEIVYFRSPPEALPLLLEALQDAQGDPLLEATVHSHIASMGDADPDAAERAALAAAEILGRPGLQADPDHLACALLDRAFHWLLATERLAADDIDRALGLLTGTGDTLIARRAQELAERCLYHLGRLRESLALDEAEYRRLTELGQLGFVPPLLQSISILELLVGDWAAARRHAQECHDLVEQGEEVWRGRAMLAQARVLAAEGELGAARTMALEALARQEAEGDAWEAVIFAALLGFIELSVPDPRAALDYLTRAAAHAAAVRVALPTVFRYHGDLVEAAVLAGELELAETVLSEQLEQPALRIPLPWILVVARRGRGQLCVARGELDEAVGWFDGSLEILEGTPLPFEGGRTLLARGRAHLKRGRRRLARADLEAALAIFEQLGARAWAAHARADLARIGGRAATRWDLTPSERSVAGLAAAGRSNREIADQLVLSVRTVESHLASTYRKLGVRSRMQLGPALERAADGLPRAP
ncbi:MAG: LuxR C-terminal-related transcriptional regulator [Candidatus Limnocylindrales bacterium]